jgi:hypothetical protein
MGEIFTPDFDHYMVKKLYHMLNFEFQPYPLAFPRLKVEPKSDETPNKLIITEFMGCQLTTSIEMDISDDVSTGVPSTTEVEDIYGRILTITFGHSKFMKTDEGDLYLPSLKFTIDNETYLISDPKFKNSDNGTYTITTKDGNISGPYRHTWGNLIITKSAI